MNARAKTELNAGQETLELVRCAARLAFELSAVLEQLAAEARCQTSIVREARAAWAELARTKTRLARMLRDVAPAEIPPNFVQVGDALSEQTKCMVFGESRYMNSASHRSIDFARVAADALGHAETIVRRWLPDGRREGSEWVARNPRRADRRKGSFKVNINTGRWGDFSTGDYGGDLVALAAYLFSLSQRDAALRVAQMIGTDPYDR